MKKYIYLAILCALIATTNLVANDNKLHSTVENLLKQNKEQSAQIELLQKQVKALSQKHNSEPARSDLDNALKAVRKSKINKKTPSNNLEIGAVLQSAIGTSSERDGNLGSLQQGGHDPHKRGFTNRGVEFSLSGAVDTYWDAELHLMYAYDHIEGESRLEIEEAFITSRNLGNNLQLELGQMHTEFGRINPRHPHAWTFLDQPIIHNRVFGADALRAPGLRLSWLSPKERYSEFHFGLQNPTGETMVSFLANDEVYGEANPAGLFTGEDDPNGFVQRDVRGIDDMVKLLRWDQAWELDNNANLKLGLSWLSGPNATGADADTTIKGLDLVYKKNWLTDEGDRRALIFEGEYIERDFDLAGTTTQLEDKGFFGQVSYQKTDKLKYGFRYERAWAKNGDGIAADPKRAERERYSPLVTWKLSEFSQIRLQYNKDHFGLAQDGNADSIWLGFDLAIGAHPAHKF